MNSSSQDNRNEIVWRLHLKSDPRTVFDAITTDSGRQRFWVESSVQVADEIKLTFVNGVVGHVKILRCERPRLFSFVYFGTHVTMELSGDDRGGTDLQLVNTGVPDDDYLEVLPGWLNVLLPLKAAVDHGIDLRNHDPNRTWDQRYVDQ